MVKSCAALGCVNRQKERRSDMGTKSRKTDVTFHRFPLKDEKRLSQWLVAIRRKAFTPTGNHRICSEHFHPDDYDESGFRRKLKSSAVPSIFNFPKHLKRATASRRALTRVKSVPRNNSKTVDPCWTQTISTDHSYSYVRTHTHSQQRVEFRKKVMDLQVKNLRQRFKIRQQKTRWAERRIQILKNQRLKDCLKKAHDKHLIGAAAHDMFENAFGGISVILFHHTIKRTKEKKHVTSYNRQMRAFSVTLHFLSPLAYDYLRPILHLPHPTILRAWRSSVKAGPGFLIQALKEALRSATECGVYCCSLLVNEMALKKEVVWCPNRQVYSGHVDYGGGPVSSTYASNVLVFMLVSLKAAWKTPVAYFLTNHIDSQTLSRCINDVLLKTADMGLLVKTIVADGLKVQALGFNFTATNPRPFIQHPHLRYQNERVWFICDPPHMLRLMHNLLSETKTIYASSDKGDRVISWSYIMMLHDLHKVDSCYLANNLAVKHPHYNNLKGKVNIAAQTLSSSVATAIDHLREDLKLSQFQGSEETCKFLRIVDELFNRLNGKNPYVKGFKAPLSNSNRDTWVAFFAEAVKYLLMLLDHNKRPLHSSPGGQAVNGFIVSAISASGLAQELLDKSNFEYLLPYKFSQDHLEMLFEKIHQRAGMINNLTAEQFRHSLKKLLLKNEVRAPPQGISILQQDKTKEISIDGYHHHARRPTESQYLVCDYELSVAAERLDRSLHLPDQDWRISCLINAAGFICQRLVTKIKCVECRDAIESWNDQDPHCTFVQRKNKRGLIMQSKGIVKVLKAAEQAFRIVMPNPTTSIHSLPYQANVDLKIQMLVIVFLKEKITILFPSFSQHFIDHEISNEEPHHLQLIRLIVSFYVQMRLRKASKLHHERVLLQSLTSKRMKLSKSVLFSRLV